ncbi:MAG: hemerythrin domain-containing protein [Bacteroidales bacterium]|nr:hemerythrin domain-containing protein [Bacteroidales bacterium]
MLLNKNTKMAEVIHTNYLLLPILERFDIPLGFGEKSILEVCTDHKVNVEFFLEIINSFHDHNYFPEVQLRSFPLHLIIQYIQKSHNYYLYTKIPQIEDLIQQLKSLYKESQKEQIVLIEKFFQEYKEEIFIHIQNEENDIFPYISTIDQAILQKRIDEKIKKMVHEKSIKYFIDTHTNIEDKLYDLKNIIIKYLPPAKDNSISHALLFELFRLERDLNDHARIEDKVLAPKVQFLESQILGK